MDISQFPICHAGVDEAGRGPLAGPVVAAAVILNPAFPIAGLMDSKLLTEKKRNHLAIEIKEKALAWAIAQADVAEIDQINILRASLLAMQRAVMQLSISPEFVFIDGRDTPKITYPALAVIKGDQLIPAISAASILAKVTRDQQMCEYDQHYPGYEFARHKGYGTARHLYLLQLLGACPLHRQSFSPVRQVRARSNETCSVE